MGHIVEIVLPSNFLGWPLIAVLIIETGTPDSAIFILLGGFVGRRSSALGDFIFIFFSQRFHLLEQIADSRFDHLDFL